MQSDALSNHYQKLAPAPGGTYREGIIGTFTNASPLYAQNNVDSSVSKLVFSGLYKYDESGELVPDVAERYELDESETLYTVYLKKDVKWHDGQPLRASDVAFTFSRIQNPEVKSYLFSSWKGVSVAAKDEYTVTFKLPNALSAFPHSLTTGIIPEHILKDVPLNQMRSNSFNNETPIGTGPFTFEAVEVVKESPETSSSKVGLASYVEYHGGTPKLDRFVIRTYNDDDALMNSFKDGEVDGVIGLDIIPEKSNKYLSYEIPVASQVMVFFKNTQEVLKDPAVRKALVLGIDKNATTSSVPYPLLVVDSPFLRSHIGYNKDLAQVTNKKDEASAMLEQAGWKIDPATGIRAKDGKPLTFKLYGGANSEFTAITGNLQKQWRELGVDVVVVLQGDEELQSTVSSHNYDALLYGISVGPDPDVFAYWHSTQADIRSDTRLNLSEYKSTVADRALEAGRTRSDPQLRTVKYRPFLEAWKNDVPALALYQPRLLYVASDDLKGFDVQLVTTTTDRFTDVQDWSVRQEMQNQ
jgi:peptide/nickel transport system substrate-binding protein